MLPCPYRQQNIYLNEMYLLNAFINVIIIKSYIYYAYLDSRYMLLFFMGVTVFITYILKQVICLILAVTLICNQMYIYSDVSVNVLINAPAIKPHIYQTYIESKYLFLFSKASQYLYYAYLNKSSVLYE